MSTSSFNLDNAAVSWSGLWPYHYTNSQEVRVPTTLSSSAWPESAFTATGTACTIRIAVTATGTNFLQASVDGGALTALTMPGSTNTFSDVTVFTGLSDAAHTVRIVANTGTITGCQWQLPNGISVTGAAPAIALSTGYGPIYDLWSMHAGRNVIFEGPHVLFSGNVNDWQQGDAGLRFRANPTSIKIFMNGTGSNKLQLFQDGVKSGSVVTMAANGWTWYTIASGLDGATHEYQIANSAAQNLVFHAHLMLVGGTFDATSSTWRKGLAFYGDSRIVQLGATIDSTSCFPIQTCLALGYSSFNYGISGTKCLSVTATALDSTEIIAPVNSYPSAYRDQWGGVVVECGYNDLVTGAPVANFQNSYTRLLRKLVIAFPDVPIWCMSIMNYTGEGAGKTTYNAAISAAVTAAGAPCTYIDTAGWIVPASDTSDGTHLIASGHTKVKNQLISIIPAATPVSGGRPVVGHGSPFIRGVA